jgi:aspartate kinase
MIVCKFGGTSVQDAEALTRLAGIIKERRNRKIIVVASAMGKTTNGLLEAAFTAAQGKRDEARQLLRKLEKNHSDEALKLGIATHEDCAYCNCFSELLKDEARQLLRELEKKHSGDTQKLGVAAHKDCVYEKIYKYFSELHKLIKGLSALGELTPRITDAVASHGELLSTAILTQVLRNNGIDAELMDARECIVTDENFTRAAPVFGPTKAAIVRHLKPVLNAGKIPVLQGFIGRSQDGDTTTIGRGGSDYTAAIVGAALDADEIQIWTDVDGIMTTDPRVVKDAHKIRNVSFQEAAELSYFGAKVLHPSTIIPAVRKNIPVRVLNSYRPEQRGTIITGEAQPCDNPVKAISFKGGVTVVNIVSTRMLMAYGFLEKIFEIFARYKVPVDVVSTSEVSVSLTVDDVSALDSITEDLKKIGEVSVQNGRAVICCVGDNLNNVQGSLHTALGALRDIKIHMISQGASAINITFVIDENRLTEAVRGLHEAFFQKIDPRIFE